MIRYARCDLHSAISANAVIAVRRLYIGDGPFIYPSMKIRFLGDRPLYIRRRLKDCDGRHQYGPNRPAAAVIDVQQLLNRNLSLACQR